MEPAASKLKKRILVVDDHALVRAGFRELIDATDDLEVGGEAGTAASALKLATTEDFDVVMLDISLPDALVVETVTMLRRRRPDLPILIVSVHAEEQYAVNLLRAGASGFFSNAGEARDLLEALRTILAGRKYISSRAARRRRRSRRRYICRSRRSAPIARVFSKKWSARGMRILLRTR